MKRLGFLFLILILITATLSYAATNMAILNLPEMTEAGKVSFDKMDDEELLVLKELLESEIKLRKINASQTAQTYTNKTAQTQTIGERNALRAAQNYLSFTAFSYSGLIRQLKFEGYSQKEATYAADNCGANWFEQAYKCAENYLSFMSFSRKGLIDQLCFEGYTREQAEYAVKKVGY